MSLTNPSKLINLQELAYFESKLADRYQAQSIDVTGITADTVEGALGELADAIASLPSAIVPKGTKTFSQLDPTTDLVAGNVGFMYNISDAFTTTENFVEGAGKSVPAGANVYIANPSTGVYKYDIFQGMYDLSGYALKSEMAVEDGTGANADKTTITLKTGTSATVLKSHQDISGKADKVTSATNGNFAGLDGNGNLTDSGSKASDFATAAQGALADTAYQLPSSGMPKTDLAQGVQDSLDLADSAYQKPSAGIPSTDMAQAVQDSLGLADSAYQKPSGGIPSTDMSSAVQTSLGKADSAVQSVALAGGTNNGTVKLTVDGTATDNIAVTGLGAAAFCGVAADADIDEIFA